MATPDLQSPYDDFLSRLAEMSRIVVGIEEAAKTPGALSTSRSGIDLGLLGGTAGNTVNAMALVFLASSFEEFVREEVFSCAEELATKYSALPDKVRHTIRNWYWVAGLDRLKFSRTILTKQKPKVPDPAAISNIGRIVSSVSSFVVNDVSTNLDAATVVHHTNNFRPWVIDELAARIGINSLVDRAADSQRLKVYFGVATKQACQERSRAKLEEFYDRRNQIVHSLSSASGYGVDLVIDYMDFFRAVADSIRGVLVRETATW